MEERNRCKICHRNARNTAYLISYIAVCFECLKKISKKFQEIPQEIFPQSPPMYQENTDIKDKFLASVILCIHGASKSVQE